MSCKKKKKKKIIKLDESGQIRIRRIINKIIDFVLGVLLKNPSQLPAPGHIVCIAYSYQNKHKRHPTAGVKLNVSAAQSIKSEQTEHIMSEQDNQSNQVINSPLENTVKVTPNEEQEDKLTTILPYPHQEAKLEPTIVHHPIYQCYYSY